MTVLEKIKIFIDEKILKKDTPKLLMAAEESQDFNIKEIDLSEIQNYIKNEKYTKNLNVSIVKLKPITRKTLLQNIQSRHANILNLNNEEMTLVEGLISGESFIDIMNGNVPDNKTGQAIYTETGNFEVITRKKVKDNIYANLKYKEFQKKENFEEQFEFDEDNAKYYRKITMSNVTFSERATYATREQTAYMENNAQPTDDPRAIQEYTRLTQLKYISNKDNNGLSNVLKINPYLVVIEAFVKNKAGEVVRRQAIHKIFKSKKECIVGYRPEMIMLEGFDEEQHLQMYRLLPEGVYIDNNTFKQNFEGKYTFKKVALEDIEKATEMQFSLSQDTKDILRNGLKLPDHIRIIYEAGLEQINKNKRI